MDCDLINQGVDLIKKKEDRNLSSLIQNDLTSSKCNFSEK